MSNRSNVADARLILPSVKGRLRNRGLEVAGRGGGAGEEVGGGGAAGRRDEGYTIRGCEANCGQRSDHKAGLLVKIINTCIYNLCC